MQTAVKFLKKIIHIIINAFVEKNMNMKKKITATADMNIIMNTVTKKTAAVKNTSIKKAVHADIITKKNIIINMENAVHTIIHMKKSIHTPTTMK